MKTIFMAGIFCSLLSTTSMAETLSGESRDAEQSSLPLELMSITGGKIRILSTSASPMKEPTTITLEDGTELHLSSDKKYFLVGDLYKLEDGRIKNISAVNRAKLYISKLEALPEDDLVIFPETSEYKGQIWVFTDVTCGYCQKLHKEVPKINAAGIRVNYVPWPRGPKGTEPYTKAQQMMCATDKRAAMNLLISGKNIETAPCDDHNIEKTHELGAQMGLKGTPFIVFENGETNGGALPAREIINAVDQIARNGALD